MIAHAWLDVGWHFDLVVLPVLILAGLVGLRVRAVRRREARADRLWRERTTR